MDPIVDSKVKLEAVSGFQGLEVWDFNLWTTETYFEIIFEPLNPERRFGKRLGLGTACSLTS